MITQIAKRIIDQGLDEDQIATNAGMTRLALSRKLRGASPVTVADIAKLSRELGVSPAELFKDAL